MTPTRTTDVVFAALGDPTRIRIVDRLAHRGPATASELARHFPMSRQAVVKHLGVLSRAGVTSRERAGREVRYRVQTKPLAQAASWIAARGEMWDEALASLRQHLER